MELGLKISLRQISTKSVRRGWSLILKHAGEHIDRWKQIRERRTGTTNRKLDISLQVFPRKHNSQVTKCCVSL